MKDLLKGKVAIVTGASQGLGYEITRKYVEAGACVAMCARGKDRLFGAREKLGVEFGGSDVIHAVPGDVADPGAVDKVVQSTFKKFGQVDILVNNAGIYGPKGKIDYVDWGEWVRAMEINLYGSVLMCRALLPHFKARSYGKIVQLSGGGATNPLPGISAYAASKAAVVRFIETLAEEVRGRGIDVNAIAPGALNTRLLDEVLAAGAEKVGQDFYDRSLKQQKSGGVPLALGAKLAVFFGSHLSDGITGKLISAKWDDWEHFPEHLEELNASDVYTLRRIVAKDRGFDWCDK